MTTSCIVQRSTCLLDTQQFWNDSIDHASQESNHISNRLVVSCLPMGISILMDSKIRDLAIENCESLGKKGKNNYTILLVNMSKRYPLVYVFFSLAAVTGCISVIFNMTSIDPPLGSG
ncbi:hypothetical protein L1887_03168 [Cichorium endivia]|nr:hypothetical protein L1887_03168 [Cichorium endivia]